MSDKLFITIFDAATGQTIVREMTDEEVAECEQLIATMHNIEQAEPDA